VAVAAGTGAPVDPCAAPTQDDPRMVAIKAYWDRYSIYPGMVFDAMATFGVDAYDLEKAIDYEVNIIQWMRFNQAPNGLGGVKQWDSASIEKVLNWLGEDVKDKWMRVYAQDALDRAARLKANNPAWVADWDAGHVGVQG
jgi:hypothetical protein